VVSEGWRRALGVRHQPLAPLRIDNLVESCCSVFSAALRFGPRPWYSHETDFGSPPSGTRPWDRGDRELPHAHPRTPATLDTARRSLQQPPRSQQFLEGLSWGILLRHLETLVFSRSLNIANPSIESDSTRQVEAMFHPHSEYPSPLSSLSSVLSSSSSSSSSSSGSSRTRTSAAARQSPSFDAGCSTLNLRISSMLLLALSAIPSTRVPYLLSWQLGAVTFFSSFRSSDLSQSI
jgi:hypothetical protein